MSEFDNWKEEFGVNDSKYSIEHYLMEQAFKAGQQSQQAKIDLLEKELTETQAFLNKQNHIKQAKIEELQARIDKTVNHIEEWYGCVELSNIVDILKGNKDER